MTLTGKQKTKKTTFLLDVFSNFEGTIPSRSNFRNKGQNGSLETYKHEEDEVIVTT